MKPSDFLFVREGICLFCKEEETYGETLCTECESRLRPVDDRFLYDGVHNCTIAYFYNRFLQEVLRSFKFHESTDLAEPIGKLLYAHVKEGDFGHITHVQPIPMHPRAERKRGYNQSVLMAEELSKHTGWRVANLLQKTRHTQEQNKLNRAERESNLEGAFSLTPRADASGMKLLLLDDFVTTGNTMKQATQVLLQAKPDSIEAFALTSPKRHRNIDFT